MKIPRLAEIISTLVYLSIGLGHCSRKNLEAKIRLNIYQNTSDYGSWEDVVQGHLKVSPVWTSFSA